jgi:NADH dehydrogenase
VTPPASEPRDRSHNRHRVVIIGGGFGGLHVALGLARANVDIIVIDRRNYHLFQPLLYQVATGGLSPGDISAPLRGVLKKQARTAVWQAEATDIDGKARSVILRDGNVEYDTLVVAPGVTHSYFGNDAWAQHAPGLKTIEDALDIRRRIFLAFEAAERERDPQRRRSLMTFVIVGAGPTGVELAGALGELAHATLKRDFRSINPEDTRILLVEGMHRVLPTYPPDLSAEAECSLAKLGVTVRTQCRVVKVEAETVTLKSGENDEHVDAATILWAAGVRASRLGAAIGRETGAEIDRAGRVSVGPDLTVPGHPEIFVIGDLATFVQDDNPLPGTAPVAIQQGRFVAEAIARRLDGRPTGRFRYVNKGNLAVIGRHAAVADLPRFRFTGFAAWFAWLGIHIWYLIGFDNKLLVMVQWAFDYFTRKRGARLITGADPQPLVGKSPDER